MNGRLLLGLTLSCALGARADVVDLTGSGSRRDGGSGFSVRAEFGNDFAPYGLVGAAISYLTPPGLAIEGGAGAGFPGVQLGLGIRQLVPIGGGTNLAFELSFAGNTKQQRAGRVVTAASVSRYIWSSLGGGIEFRGNRVSLSAIAALAFTPADESAHFGFHGGLGYLF